ncbi:hypothetical protein TSAR_009283 [Trichomalopsis sarcophagae]|uniref:Odorant receptor n=1 Tax=Trichomalopsis sarcophagae TaxID=543379 RepID=A0A232F315_9HYME|nr:hypothetical protein TSAR_009283 [Trichomalopsis sarcophagae]
MQNKYEKSGSKNHSMEMVGYTVISLCLKCLGVYTVSSTNDKLWIRVYSSLWWFYLLNHVVFFLATVYAFFTSKVDVISLSYSFMEGLFALECIILLLHFKFQGPRLRNLLVNANVQVSRKKTLTILNNNNTYILIASLIALIYVISFSLYANKPKTVYYRKYFTQARYPFEINSTFATILIWCHQSIAVLHMLLIPTSDALVVLLLYACTVQFKILESNIRKGRSKKKLQAYVREHNDIFLTVEETNRLVRVIVIKTVVYFMIFSISTGIQILNKNAVVSQLIFQLMVTAIVSLRFYAESIGLATYFTSWYEEKLKFLIAKLMIIRRCQSLPKIYLSGFMPKLDRQYLGMVSLALSG